MPVNNKERILIVEDERPMRVALADLLASEGYRVLTAENGEHGLEKAIAERPDLVLLDIMMPHLDGLEVCTELRRLSIYTRVLMLTAKGQVQDRVRGLESGADDYLVKPFSSDELVARVRALLRRSGREAAGMNRLSLGTAEIDFAARTAKKDGRNLHLAPKEFAMLHLLAENRGAVVSRERFLDVVWGCGAFPTTRTVDNHIALLRSKLEPVPEEPRFIQTVHGTGYRLIGGDFANP